MQGGSFLLSNAGLWTQEELAHRMRELHPFRDNRAETVSKMFDHPQGGSYDFVFDLTGEGILGTDFPEQVCIHELLRKSCCGQSLTLILALAVSLLPSRSSRAHLFLASVASAPQFLLERTTKLASLLGREAARRKVRAYIRDVPPFLTIEPKEDAAKEGDVAKPKTARAYWWYEASRALADIEGLNLVLLRSAAIWGPHQYHGAGECVLLG